MIRLGRPQAAAQFVVTEAHRPAPVRPAASAPGPTGRLAAGAIDHLPLVTGTAADFAYSAQRRIAPAGGSGSRIEAAALGTGTPLPAPLRQRVEQQSGLSMDHVRVHRNSPEPEKLDALAFARGGAIHLAPGEDRHLPHEAWHLAQQAQGRVRPTLSVGGVAINDGAALEAEADAFGRGATVAAPVRRGEADGVDAAPAQRVIKIGGGRLAGEYKTQGGYDTRKLVKRTDKDVGEDLKRGWRGYVRAIAKLKTRKVFADDEAFYDHLREKFPAAARGARIRPGFSSSAYALGRIGYGVLTGTDQSGLKPSDHNLAMPHRFPYKSIETSTQRYIAGTETSADLDRWSDRLIRATRRRLTLNLPHVGASDAEFYKRMVARQFHQFEAVRRRLKAAVDGGAMLDLDSPLVLEFLKRTNDLHGNVSDYGPHAGINIQVADRIHMHFHADGTMTPGTEAAISMTPHRVPKGVAYTSDRSSIVTTEGRKYLLSKLAALERAQIEAHAVGVTSIDATTIKG